MLYSVIIKKYNNMKDYSKLTTAELVVELEKLDVALGMDLMMDGSGECGGIICKSYDKYFEAIYEELNTREDWEPFSDEDEDEMPF